jgi:hypothetical protein
MSLSADPVRVLLGALSQARLGARIGAWMDSPDLAGWLLLNGKHYDWLTDQLPNGVRTGKNSRCYEESQDNSLKCPQLIYCEGYAAANGFEAPVPHAWCLDRKNNLGVVDTVWKGRQSKDRIYFGVPFQKSFVRRFRDKPGRDMSILLWSEAEWPIQTGKVNKLEWMEALP